MTNDLEAVKGGQKAQVSATQMSSMPQDSVWPMTDERGTSAHLAWYAEVLQTIP